MPDAHKPRLVAIVAYPDVQSLDVTGPLEVFATAQRIIEATGRRDRGYHVQVLSRDGQPLTTSSGLAIAPHAALASAPRWIDTLIVAGGPGHAHAAEDAELIKWLQGAARNARRTASVCTGAFVLARAGLLDGRRATTHWAWANRLQRQYPQVRVDPEPIYVRDGSTWTSAGVTAGMDLALALVEQDLDRELALAIARQLVLFLRRPGSQSQFSATLAAQRAAREPLREIQRAVLEDVAGDHSVEAMAARAHMSPRHFARAFRAETGVTPARHVELVRLEAARRLLEDTRQPIAAVAARCGFRTPETLRRAFLRTLHVGPAEYRRRFHAHVAPDHEPASAPRQQPRSATAHSQSKKETVT
ncbi:MAG TPA: GlxA family transcriptional regulator [Solirubrobacteraceae bacterium]|jgi:transcriptional regulator GlxA family with amidase domain|nr:GlxA family transcriptional regulator [Solirubrobacteraceae bacterium]